MAGKRVFMVSYGGGHANIIKHIYRALDRHDDVEIYYLALTAAPMMMQREGIPCHRISEAVEMLPCRDRVLELGKRYGLEFHNASLGIELEDTIAYYGCGIYDLIRSLGEEAGLAAFRQNGRKAFLPVGIMQELLRQIRPDVCIVTSSPRMEHACGIAANELGIPVLKINDLPISSPIPFRATICVMNEWAKQYAVDYADAPEADVVVTGQPVFEEDLQRDEPALDRLRAELRMDDYGHKIVFFTQNGKDQTEELSTLYGMAERFPDDLFVVKLHPNQDVNTFPEPKTKNIVLRKDAAKHYLHLCDLSITTVSTTGLEAAITGKPLVVLNFDGSHYLLDYEKMGIGLMARTPEQMEHLAVRLLDPDSEESRRLAQGRKQFRIIPGAADRIADLALVCVAEGGRAKVADVLQNQMTIN